MSIRVSFMHIRVAPQAKNQHWYINSLHLYTDGICWYIAHIPMVYRLYTDGISPIYQFSTTARKKTIHDPFASYSRSLHVAPQTKIYSRPLRTKKNYKIIIFLNSPPSTRTHIINNVYFCTLNLFERHLHERNKLYTNQTLLFYIYLL